VTFKADGTMKVKAGLMSAASVETIAIRTWQRKWRDVLHAREAIADVYQGSHLDVDELTRRIEGFFKACHELGDWLEEETGLPATRYAKTPPTLELCDAIAQTAKHHTRHQPWTDPITAVVVKLFSDKKGIHGDIAWTSNSGNNGQTDALELADQCIAQWKKFFQKHNLNPKT
jgi:hypothetical protein